MNAAAGPGFRRESQLRDGTPIVIRAIRSDDRERIVAAFNKLDPETIYTRFFTAKARLSESDLARIEASDFVRAVALVATLGDGNDEVIIGAGGYTVLGDPANAHEAEVSFTIEEDFHGQGLAGQLLADLTVIARERGLQHFVAEVLSDNPAMVSVFRRSGLPMTTTRADGVVHVAMDLRTPT